MRYFPSVVLAVGMISSVASRSEAQFSLAIGNPYTGQGVYVGAPAYGYGNLGYGLGGYSGYGVGSPGYAPSLGYPGYGGGYGAVYGSPYLGGVGGFGYSSGYRGIVRPVPGYGFRGRPVGGYGYGGYGYRRPFGRGYR